MTESHRKYHGLKVARCKTPWDQLIGDTPPRHCERCGANVYPVEAEDQGDVTSPGAELPEHIGRTWYRRFDGTVTPDFGRCANFPNLEDATTLLLLGLVSAFFSWGLFSRFRPVGVQCGILAAYWLFIGFVFLTLKPRKVNLLPYILIFGFGGTFIASLGWIGR